MASVQARRLASGSVVWRVLYRLDGQQTSDTFPTERDARKHVRLIDQVGAPAARQHLMDLARGDDPDLLTLEQWTEQYLATASGITEGTRSEYTRLAKRTFLAQLGARPLDGLTRDGVRRWVNWQAQVVTRSGTPTSAKTIANAHGLLSTVLAGAIERSDALCW